MKGQSHLIFKMDMEFEFGQVDSYGVVDIFSHYFSPRIYLKRQEILPKTGMIEKKSDGTYGQIFYQRGK